jgi:hypothetical protein
MAFEENKTNLQLNINKGEIEMMKLIQTNEQKAREQRVHYQSEHLIKKGEEQWLNY